MVKPRYAVVEAPSALGLFPGGVEQLSAALLKAGLADALTARRAGLVGPPRFEPQRDVTTGLLNPTGVRDYAHQLAETTGELLDGGGDPDRARGRLLDNARQPAGAQPPWALRPALPRRPRRLLPARSRTSRRGRLHGLGPRHGTRSTRRRRPRRPRPADPRRRRRGLWTSRRRGSRRSGQPAHRGIGHHGSRFGDRARPRRRPRGA